MLGQEVSVDAGTACIGWYVLFGEPLAAAVLDLAVCREVHDACQPGSSSKQRLS